MGVWVGNEPAFQLVGCLQVDGHGDLFPCGHFNRGLVRLVPDAPVGHQGVAAGLHRQRDAAIQSPGRNRAPGGPPSHQARVHRRFCIRALEKGGEGQAIIGFQHQVPGLAQGKR